MKARRQWKDIFKILEKKTCQHRIPYPGEIALKIEGKNKTHFQKKKKKKSSKSLDNSLPATRRLKNFYQEYNTNGIFGSTQRN